MAEATDLRTQLEPWLVQLMRKRWVRWITWIVFAGLAVFVVLAVYAVSLFTQDEAVTYDNIVDHFKYGSTGGERESGFPYWIFQALPQVCASHLPGKGYASLGLIYEKGRDLPIGMSKRRYQGIERTFLNCAVCHTSTVRDAPGMAPRVVVGMPANTFNLGALQKFFFDCARDPKFSTEFVVPEIARLMREHDQKLGLFERYAVYPLAIWIMRERLLMLRGRMEPLLTQTEWGPGRVDTFNPNKILFGIPLDQLPEREKNPPVDFPSIWMQKPRQGMQLHWDGNNIMAEERNKNAAFGTGTTPPTIDLAAIGRLEKWMLTVEPPKYPYPIDDTKAARGQKIYAEYCAGCHGKNGREFSAPEGRTARACVDPKESEDVLYGPQVGKITRIEEVGTDRHRLDSFSYDLAVNLGTVYAGYPHRYCHYRKTYGYANMPLDGIWLRAPYLHNGSVPSLRDLLEPSADRPRVFYRGNDVYDAQRVGFVSEHAAQGTAKYFRFDTSLPGNSNAGHEGRYYGTTLAPDDKDALVEYLKTF
ncbi:MAG: c-type cytochrome [Betaproteobacteria bacterium]|nr:c-type cytochrome [Betaproteobacteria bacterium]